MTSRHVYLGVALAVCSCLFLSACHRETGQGEWVDTQAAASHTITIKIDSSNACTQQLDSGAFSAAPLASLQATTSPFRDKTPMVEAPVS